MESVVAALVKDTTQDLATWARHLWDGRDVDVRPLATRLEAAMFLAILNELAGSGGPPLHQYGQTAPVRRYAAPTAMPGGGFFTTFFQEALAALIAKAPVLSSMSPREMDPLVRQTAWYVSGGLAGNMVESLKTELVATRARGGTQAEFIQWATTNAQVSAPHMETVFRTNLASAAGAGRWKQYHDPDVADLIVAYRYANPVSHRSRPCHAAMNGFVAVKSDPIWPIIWTPCGFNCRCHIRDVHRGEAIKRGILDAEGNVLAPRIYASDLQEQVATAAMGGGTVVIDGELHQFPDEGFRGNALIAAA